MALAQALTIIERDSGRHFDPEVVVIFKEIAPVLYATALQAGNAGLRQEMQAVLSRYFRTAAGPPPEPLHTLESPLISALLLAYPA
jgi:hypothetical protein